jgi:hypothetical protein
MSISEKYYGDRFLTIEDKVIFLRMTLKSPERATDL